MSEIEALAWDLLGRIEALHKQGKLSKAALLGLNDAAAELRRALMRAAINYALSGVRLEVRESEPGAALPYGWDETSPHDEPNAAGGG
jgi:hypothetical protein